MSRRRVVAQWMWLSVSSLRSAVPCCRARGNSVSSVQLGYSGAQSRRDTAKAPQALAQVAQVAWRLALQPAAQEARHEGVAGAEHVVDLDRKALADDAVLEVVGDRRRHRRCSPWRRASARWSPSETARIALSAAEQVALAGGDQHLLLGADDQVAIGEDRLELAGDAVGLDVALEAGGVAGEAPEVRAGSRCRTPPCGRAALAMRIALRCAASALARGEMRAGDDDGARPRR